MRLTVINSRFLPLVGGGETYTMEVMEYFSALGWDVHLITQERGYGLSRWHDCTIHTIDGFDNNSQNLFKYAPALRRLLKEMKPDIIHVHGLLPYFAFSNVVDPGEFKTVLTIHETPALPERLIGKFGDVEAEMVFVQQLLANGKHQKLLVGNQYYLDSYAIAAPSIQTNGYSEVLYYFPPEKTCGPLVAKEPKTGGICKVLFPSRISKRKGIEECLRALATLPERFVLLLPAYASDETGVYCQSIDTLIDELMLTTRIIKSESPVTLREMARYYEQTDMVVIPSHFEGFGIVAVEAMSWGIPIIATATGGLKEIIQHHVHGWQIPPQDSASLAEAIRYLESEPDLRSTLSKNAIERVQDTFNREKHMHRLEETYKEIVQQ